MSLPFRDGYGIFWGNMPRGTSALPSWTLVCKAGSPTSAAPIRGDYESTYLHSTLFRHLYANPCCSKAAFFRRGEVSPLPPSLERRFLTVLIVRVTERTNINQGRKSQPESPD